MTDNTLERSTEYDVVEENVTFEDFLQRYLGQRVEWHAGKVVKKMSNNEKHQFILSLLHTLLSLYLMFSNKGRVYMDGYQMRLKKDDPARQPDLLIVFNEHKDRIKEQYLDGPADLVVEILSPATKKIDRGDKYYEYEEAGIPEYWIIDPISKRVDVYNLDDEGNYQQVGTTDKITSTVLDGFELDAKMLWQDDLPDGAQAVQLVQKMLGLLDD
ncbi:MAG: Uma2 family endonuclease [Chloroflexota bacterium]